MYLIHVKSEFCAAHHLDFSNGSSEKMHGHNWMVEIIIKCPQLDQDGIGIDFLVVQRKLEQLLDQELDHQNLNTIEGLSQPNPTSECLARWIAERLKNDLTNAKSCAKLSIVTVWETENFGVSYNLPD